MIVSFFGALFGLGVYFCCNSFIATRKPRTKIVERNLRFNILETQDPLISGFNWLTAKVKSDRFFPWGIDSEVEISLRHANDVRTLAQFRRSQIMSMFGVQSLVLVWIGLRNLGHHHVRPETVVLLLLACIPVSGWFLFSFLQTKVKKRTHDVDQQLATILELLAFSVSAGEPVMMAIKRVSDLCVGELAEILKQTSQRLALGFTISQCLNMAHAQSASPSFQRSIRAIRAAIDRGTPIATVLRAQANDSRSLTHQNLLSLAGKKDGAMMAPIVFLILPMIVFIALYPGLKALQLG